nr:MAG TPA: hypothetical protein [Caudoviricetes sp.]
MPWRASFLLLCRKSDNFLKCGRVCYKHTAGHKF